MSAAPRGFVAVLAIHLHFPDCASLKAKRRELAPVKAQVHGRLGASVAEVGHQDQWQRATLIAVFAAGSPRHLDEAVEALRGWLDARFPAGARIDRRVLSLHDLGL